MIGTTQDTAETPQVVVGVDARQDRTTEKRQKMTHSIPHVSTVTKVVTLVLTVAAVAAPKKW